MTTTEQLIETTMTLQNVSRERATEIVNEVTNDFLNFMSMSKRERIRTIK